MSAVEEQADGNSQSLSKGYATFFWTFYSLQAVFTAYFPVYCVSLGFSAFQTALITAAENFANLFGPPLATRYLYRFFSPKGVVLLCMVGVFVFYAPLVFMHSFVAVLVLYFLMFCANKSAITTANAAAVKTADGGGINYGRVRIWGCFGFIIATYIIGLLSDVIGAQAIVLVGLIFCGLLVSSVVRQGHVFGETKLRDLNTQVSVLDVFFSPSLRRSLGLLLITVGFGWASQAVFFTYFSVFLTELGWSGAGISSAWTVAVVGEMVVFYYFDNIAKHVSLRLIYIVSLWVAVLRWGLIGASTLPEMIFFSQILHSICFGAYYVATMKLLYQSAPKGFGERAIGYFSVFGPGLGLMLGRLLAGAAAEYLGEGASLQPLFWLAAVLSAIGAVLALKIRVPAAKREEPEIAHGLSALACDHGECP